MCHGRTSLADLLCGRHNSMSFGSQDSGTGAQDQQLPDKYVLFLLGNLLLISALKSTVTLLTSDPMQANTHPKIQISDIELPLARIPKLLDKSVSLLFI